METKTWEKKNVTKITEICFNNSTDMSVELLYIIYISATINNVYDNGD